MPDIHSSSVAHSIKRRLAKVYDVKSRKPYAKLAEKFKNTVRIRGEDDFVRKFTAFAQLDPYTNVPAELIEEYNETGGINAEYLPAKGDLATEAYFNSARNHCHMNPRLREVVGVDYFDMLLCCILANSIIWMIIWHTCDNQVHLRV